MSTATYSNPVWPGYFADPFVMAAEGRFFAFGTGDGTTAQSLVGLTSPDLVHWQDLGAVLDPGALRGAATHLWAPEVAHIDGRYTMYFSAGVEDRGHVLRAATSTRPEGPYRVLPDPLTDEPFAIDPHPFRDTDGSWYLFYAVDRLEGSRVGTGVVVDRLLAPSRLAGAPRPVVMPSADWQLFLNDRAMYDAVYDWHTCEGPFVLRRQDRYWCLYSGGNWQEPSYGVSACSAPHPLGPWTDESESGPLVVRTSPGEVVGPGHVSVVTDATGTDWLVYHAWDPDRSARRMCLDPLRWTADGPVCDGPSTGARPAPVVR